MERVDVEKVRNLNRRDEQDSLVTKRNPPTSAALTHFKYGLQLGGEFLLFGFAWTILNLLGFKFASPEVRKDGFRVDQPMTGNLKDILPILVPLLLFMLFLGGGMLKGSTYIGTNPRRRDNVDDDLQNFDHHVPTPVASSSSLRSAGSPSSQLTRQQSRQVGLDSSHQSFDDNPDVYDGSQSDAQLNFKDFGQTTSSPYTATTDKLEGFPHVGQVIKLQSSASNPGNPNRRYNPDMMQRAGEFGSGQPTTAVHGPVSATVNTNSKPLPHPVPNYVPEDPPNLSPTTTGNDNLPFLPTGPQLQAGQDTGGIYPPSSQPPQLPNNSEGSFDATFGMQLPPPSQTVPDFQQGPGESGADSADEKF